MLMAIGLYFAPSSMTAAQYDSCIERLKEAGEGSPEGRLYHACFGSPEKLMVFDVWESKELFDRFGETLMPILKDIGVEATEPQVMPIHNAIYG